MKIVVLVYVLYAIVSAKVVAIQVVIARAVP